MNKKFIVYAYRVIFASILAAGCIYSEVFLASFAFMLIGLLAAILIKFLAGGEISDETRIRLYKIFIFLDIFKFLWNPFRGTNNR